MFWRHLFALVLHGIEEQAVVLLEDGQHGLAADRGPAAEGHGDLVLLEELLRLFGEERPVRSAVDDDGLDLLAHARRRLALISSKVKSKHVAQRGFADGHRAAERVEHADFDRVFGGDAPTLRKLRRRLQQSAERRVLRIHFISCSFLILIVSSECYFLLVHVPGF